MICQHLTEAADPAPRTPYADGCPDCVAVGATDWVHLRKCLTCGYVGCCDSSPRRHMSRHHTTEDHPAMRSYEPGETWRWCFVDDLLA